MAVPPLLEGLGDGISLKKIFFYFSFSCIIHVNFLWLYKRNILFCAAIDVEARDSEPCISLYLCFYAYVSPTSSTFPLLPWLLHICCVYRSIIFQYSKSKTRLYIKFERAQILIFCLYIDKLIYVSNGEKVVDEFKSHSISEFKMMDFGLTKLFVGLGVKQCGNKTLFTKKST